MLKRIIEKYHSLSVVVKAGMWFTICNFLQRGISFITIPIFTRIMSTEEYGLYTIYSSWYSILVIFATLHLSYYVFNKGLVKFDNDRENFTVSIQSLSCIITIIFILLYLPFKESINHYIGLPTMMVILMLMQILFEPPVLYWTARKRFEYDYKAVILVTIAISILNPALAIVLIKLSIFDSSALARVVSIVFVSSIFGILFGLIIANKGSRPFSTKYWKYALSFNLPLIPHYLSTSILNSADRIMIGDMVGKSEAGIYSVAYSIGMVSILFSQAAQQAYLPWLYKKMKVEDYEKISSITNSLLIGMMILLALVICFAPEIVWIVGSHKYMDAVWTIPPICGSVFFIFLQNMYANIEYYFEKTKLISIASVAVAILNVFLNYVFIKQFGYLAAGYTTLACYILYCLAHYAVMVRVCKQNHIESKSLFNDKMSVLVSFSMIMIVSVMLLVYQNDIIRYSLLLIILIVVYLIRKRLFEAIKTFNNSNNE